MQFNHWTKEEGIKQPNKTFTYIIGGFESPGFFRWYQIFAFTDLMSTNIVLLVTSCMPSFVSENIATYTYISVI